MTGEPHPWCVLMSGLPGSGKTRLALMLADHGFTRLCPDEEMLRRHGRRGHDYPRSEYLIRERTVLDDMATELCRELVRGAPVVFDHGLWTREVRAEWLARVSSVGATPLMVYLPVPHEVRWARVQARNAEDSNIPAEFDENDLLRYATRFEPPGVDESHLVYDGDPKTVLTAVRRRRRAA